MTGPFLQVDDSPYKVTTVGYFLSMLRPYLSANKPAVEGDIFLFSLMCHFSCSDIHIADKGGEFVNKVQVEHYKMTNTTHHNTSVYDSQENGLVEYMNCVMKMTILKCINDQGYWI